VTGSSRATKAFYPTLSIGDLLFCDASSITPAWRHTGGA
jgi:hypothetical protein